MLPRCILRLIELFDPHAIEYGKFVVMHECTIMINCCFKLDIPFHGFFDFFIWTSSEKSVDTTEKSAIKLIKLPNLKEIC